MNRFIKSILLIFTVVVLFQFSAYADGDHESGDGHFHPDSLEIITVSGSVIVDSTMMYPMYFLDENGDNEVDYHLNFGPSWDEPDSSLATRPEDGEEITIYGGLYIAHEDSFKIVVVYEINGQFWREPFAALWNNMGGHHGDGGHHTGHGYAFGWMHDTPEVININGTVLVDTTFIHEFFYLDENEDNQPDYFLNFGPPWFEPVSGIKRPTNGQSVSILGAEIDQHTIPMLIVYEIDGQVWRNSSAFGSHFGGGWIDKDMSESRYFHAPFDTMDRMEIEPGWHGGMEHGHGSMMSDSLFCQILEIFPQNIPNRDGQHIFAAYEVGMYNPDGSNNMWMGGMNGGHMNFNSNVDFILHYNDIQLQGEGIDENSIEVKYWDDLNDQWVTISDIIVDPENNTVSYSDNEISNFVILTGSRGVTFLTGERLLTVKGFNLKQNYPNPFNPQTTIEFELQNSGFVTLNVYNVLGQKIITLLNGEMSNGPHKINFLATSLPSGIYYYSLESGGERIVRRMILMQ